MSGPRRIHAVVSHDLCMGTAMCLQSAPGAFELSDEGLSVFVEGGEWTPAQLYEARDGCPMSAITILEVDHEK